MSRRRTRSRSPAHHTTNSNDPRDLERRIFVGNLPTTLMDRKDMEDLFSPYGKINDVNMAAERRQSKAQSRQTPPRRNPYGSGGYGDGREPRGRSHSPVHGRDHREPRLSHPRDHPPRDPNFDRYHGSEGREKDHRGDPRDAPYRDEPYDRYYRMDDYYRKKEDPYSSRYRDPWNGRREPEDDRPRMEERRRNELYWQYYEELQRRYDSERPVDCSVIVVNKQQKEYAETVGRKVRDLGMVVDLIFLNTEVSLTQALEDVGRARTPFAIIITQQHQVHRSCTVNILFGTPQEHRNMPMQDAMVLVAHNYDAFKAEHRDKEREEIACKAAKMADDVLMREHEREGHPVSLLTSITLLSEDRYLTVEELDRLIDYLRDKRDRLVGGSSSDPLAGTHSSAVTASMEAPQMAPAPQNLSNAPMSSMAQHTSHTTLQVHTTHTAHTAQQAHTSLPTHTVHGAQTSLVAHPGHTSHLAPPSQAPNPPQQTNQQELQARILSLFNSGAGAPVASSSVAPQVQGYATSLSGQSGVLSAALTPSSVPKLQQPSAPSPGGGLMGVRPALRPPAMVPSNVPSQFAAPNRLTTPQGAPRSTAAAAGINFDNPSVQKALDTLIQSGPSINHLVNSANASAPRPQQGMGQPPPPMALYPRHY